LGSLTPRPAAKSGRTLMAANSVTPMAKPPMARASSTSAVLPGSATRSMSRPAVMQPVSSRQGAASAGAMRYRNAAKGEVALQNRHAAHGINRSGVGALITLCVHASEGRASAPVFVGRCDRRLGQGVEVQVEAEDGPRVVFRHVQPIHIHGEDGEDVAVRAVARGRGGAAETGLAVVGAALDGAL